MLCKIQFGHFFIVSAAVVYFITIQQKDQVGILFDGPAVSQISESWPFIYPILKFTIELR